MRRSLLFLPGNTPNMLINGSCLGSDAVIFDLEDAVSPAEKDAARILVRNTMTYMDFRGCETIVRINGIDTPYWQEDLDEVLPCRPNLILLPKTGTAADVQTADAYMTQVEQRLGLAPNTVGLVALIETALGVENAFAIASASPRVTALFLGAEDLTADLQCKRTKESREIEYARTRLVVAARALGWMSTTRPLPTSTTTRASKWTPSMQRLWALPARLPSPPAMWRLSTGCSAPHRRISTTPMR